MTLVVWCMDGQGYQHPFPGTMAAIDGNVLHVRESESFKIVSSYSLYNVVRWGIEE